MKKLLERFREGVDLIRELVLHFRNSEQQFDELKPLEGIVRVVSHVIDFEVDCDEKAVNYSNWAVNADNFALLTELRQAEPADTRVVASRHHRHEDVLQWLVVLDHVLLTRLQVQFVFHEAMQLPSLEVKLCT